MDKEELGKRYLEKLSNDINERLYDLLIVHLMNVRDKITYNSENSKELTNLLDIAISNLTNNMEGLNLNYCRYILLVCNTLLYYNKGRQDLKDLKKELIARFSNADPTDQEKIPLKYQINEVRITYDVSYLTYLIDSFIKQKLWAEALYCLITVRLVEPDNLKLEEQYEIIKENIANEKTKPFTFQDPLDNIVLLDSNIAISYLMKNIEELDYSAKTINLKKLEDKNKVIITHSVKEEVANFIDYQLSILKKDKIKYEAVKKKLEEKYDEMVKRYYCNEVPVSKELLEKIETFYSRFLGVLEVIVLQKIDSKKISHKLRKLAQRESLLPERGDMKLLAEAITMQEGLGDKVTIVSDDKDFTIFAQAIKDNFNIIIYNE
ncbi:MAG: hypothetical protein PHN56_01915 [Candidatus Nanoarchaeia archaeon]|nr:hypothetical protein [Candidatus Nanoarchaeia archaeon]